MNPIAVYICNYNGEKYLKKCLYSLINQRLSIGFDIYVIDNASIDNSVEMIHKEFPDRVNCIVNDRNLGGTGGFNVGLRDAIQKEYRYVVLLDNDAFLESNALLAFYNYMEEHSECGIAGAKIYMSDLPNVIQEFGSYVDFEKFKMELGFYHEIDRKGIPEVCECDYVPACAMMIRGEALKKTGVFPENNFIYWDDIEFGIKMNLSGYKVVAYDKAVAWHRGGGNKKKDTPFPKYYFFRNQWNFFSRYIEENRIVSLCDNIISNAYIYIRGFHMKGMYDLERSIIYALNDFIYGVSGKCDEYKILPQEGCEESLTRLLDNLDCVYVECRGSDFKTSDELIEVPYLICAGIFHRCKQIKIKLIGDETVHEYIRGRMETMGNTDWDIEFFKENEIINDGKVVLRMCSHIKDILDKKIVQVVWIDRYCNCIIEEKEYSEWEAWEELFVQFSDFYRPQVMKRIVENMMLEVK